MKTQHQRVIFIDYPSSLKIRDKYANYFANEALNVDGKIQKYEIIS